MSFSTCWAADTGMENTGWLEIRTVHSWSYTISYSYPSHTSTVAVAVMMVNNLFELESKKVADKVQIKYILSILCHYLDA